MERELFDWVSWDGELETLMTFFEVTLKTKVGEYEAGTKFDQAIIENDTIHGKGKLSFMIGDETVATFALYYRVGEEVV